MTGISKAGDTKRGGEGSIAEREMRTWPRVPPPVLTNSRRTLDEISHAFHPKASNATFRVSSSITMTWESLEKLSKENTNPAPFANLTGSICMRTASPRWGWGNLRVTRQP